MESAPKRLRPNRVEAHCQKDGYGSIVFLTICTAKRKPILANPESHQILIRAWDVAEGWRVGRYVIMPDHVHFFCRPNESGHPSLSKWIRYWKSRVTSYWPEKNDKPIWQASFWDRDLRSHQAYSDKWDYVWNNPVRHGLINHPARWPYQGELHILEWDD